MRLVFHRRVQGEANEAVEWYEGQREGLGNDFFDKIQEGLEQIRLHPKSFGFWLASKKIRRFKLRRFPYDILFEIKEDCVKVLCIRHEKRHPNFGMGRQ